MTTTQRPLRQKAMLVHLTVRAWSGKKVDADVTREVAERANVDKSVGVYTKRLFPKKALADLVTIGNDARHAHYLFTMPWDDKGTRLLPVALYDRFKGTLDNIIERHRQAKQVFLSAYDDHIDEARVQLGDLFQQGDYPSRAELDSQLSISYDIDPVPDADHFVADIATEEAKRIKEGIEKSLEARIQGTVLSLFQRINEMVQLCSNRLDTNDEGKPNVFRDTMVDNLRTLTGLLADLNVTDNLALLSMRDKLDEALADVTPDNLRMNNKLFDQGKYDKVRATIDELAESMAGYFGGTP